LGVGPVLFGVPRIELYQFIANDERGLFDVRNTVPPMGIFNETTVGRFFVFSGLHFQAGQLVADRYHICLRCITYIIEIVLQVLSRSEDQSRPAYGLKITRTNLKFVRIFSGLEQTGDGHFLATYLLSDLGQDRGETGDG
jgi:hypothetical protein